MKDFIELSDLMKVDIQICKVVSADRVPKRNKLLVLKLETSLGFVQSITNIGDKFSPDDLIGKNFPFILNLSPVTIAGYESKAMIMAISGEEMELIVSKSPVGSAVI